MFQGNGLVCFEGGGRGIQVQEEAGLGGPENEIIKFLGSTATWD